MALPDPDRPCAPRPMPLCPFCFIFMHAPNLLEPGRDTPPGFQVGAAKPLHFPPEQLPCNAGPACAPGNSTSPPVNGDNGAAAGKCDLRNNKGCRFRANLAKNRFSPELHLKVGDLEFYKDILLQHAMSSPLKLWHYARLLFRNLARNSRLKDCSIRFRSSFAGRRPAPGRGPG
jgi:hypothetical protein